MKRNDTTHKQFEKLSLKFYKAEVKRNKLKVKDKELKNKIELRTPKVSKERQDKLKDKIKKLNTKIQKLKSKETKNIRQLSTKSNAIKDNPSIKEDIIRKGSAYKMEISFLKKNLNDFEKKIKLYKVKASDKDGLKKYQYKRLEHKEKLKIAEKDTKELQKEYLEFQEKIRTKHQHRRRKDLALSVQNLDAYYGSKKTLHGISLDFPKNKIISLIGASGSGKSTLLRTMNRINDEIPSFRAKGKILYHDYMDVLKLRSIYDSQERITIPELRTNIGMVFQQPNPFPMSVYKNVIYGPKINGIKGEAILRSIAEKSLKRSALWDEVKDNLSQLGTSLSGGQQQRLCIARAIANSPDILLMDEPTSALDPLAAAKIEELILELKEKYTIIIVTHSMQQAKRISDFTAFLHDGRLVEYGPTKNIFSKPIRTRTKDYISGKFG